MDLDICSHYVYDGGLLIVRSVHKRSYLPFMLATGFLAHGALVIERPFGGRCGVSIIALSGIMIRTVQSCTMHNPTTSHHPLSPAALPPPSPVE